jgi:hypothetical protein
MQLDKYCASGFVADRQSHEMIKANTDFLANLFSSSA